MESPRATDGTAGRGQGHPCPVGPDGTREPSLLVAWRDTLLLFSPVSGFPYAPQCLPGPLPDELRAERSGLAQRVDGLALSPDAGVGGT